MAPAKLTSIILLRLIAVALGFTIPEYEVDNPSSYYEFAFEEQHPMEDNEILIRKARSPQDRIGEGVEHSDQHGTNANLNCNHGTGGNFEPYGEVARNFWGLRLVLGALVNVFK